MSFTKDITTDLGKVRYLIGDLTQATAAFQDEELAGFLDFSDGSIYLACASAMASLASTAASNLLTARLGRALQIDEEAKVKALQAQADAFLKLDSETPAFGIAEENLSGFNELNIIRNFILRTEA